MSKIYTNIFYLAFVFASAFLFYCLSDKITAQSSIIVTAYLCILVLMSVTAFMLHICCNPPEANSRFYKLNQVMKTIIIGLLIVGSSFVMVDYYNLSKANGVNYVNVILPMLPLYLGFSFGRSSSTLDFSLKEKDIVTTFFKFTLVFLLSAILLLLIRTHG